MRAVTNLIHIPTYLFGIVMAVSLVAAPEMAVGQGNVRCNWIKLDDAFGNGELQENGMIQPVRGTRLNQRTLCPD